MAYVYLFCMFYLVFNIYYTCNIYCLQVMKSEIIKIVLLFTDFFQLNYTIIYNQKYLCIMVWNIIVQNKEYNCMLFNRFTCSCTSGISTYLKSLADKIDDNQEQLPWFPTISQEKTTRLVIYFYYCNETIKCINICKI